MDLSAMNMEAINGDANATFEDITDNDAANNNFAANDTANHNFAVNDAANHNFAVNDAANHDFAVNDAATNGVAPLNFAVNGAANLNFAANGDANLNFAANGAAPLNFAANGAAPMNFAANGAAPSNFAPNGAAPLNFAANGAANLNFAVNDAANQNFAVNEAANQNIAGCSSSTADNQAAQNNVANDNTCDSAASSSGSSSSKRSPPLMAQADKLYEINDDPRRKEFLDDLFSFMQKRGTPINRLPIMAKSVLDLYELYNLVIARGGLVDVINKKLWQEIIKGLHLPSSITSAAFTLRTQYMKYLYPYECEKQNLSNPSELQTAIDGNRREGRRSGYNHQYDVMRGASTSASLNPLAQMQQMQQFSRMQTAMAAQGLFFPALAIPNVVHPSHPQPMSQPTNGGPIPGLPPNELEARMMKYVEYLNKEMRNSTAAAAVAAQQVAAQQVVAQQVAAQQVAAQQVAMSPLRLSPPSTSQAAIHPYDISTRMALWNIYNNNQQAPVEPQQEALNLANGSSSSPIPVKEEPEEHQEDCTPSPKKMRRDNGEAETSYNPIPSTATNMKIDTRGDLRNGDASMVVSMEFNGIKYQGVLFAQTAHTSESRTPISS